MQLLRDCRTRCNVVIGYRSSSAAPSGYAPSQYSSESRPKSNVAPSDVPKNTSMSIILMYYGASGAIAGDYCTVVYTQSLGVSMMKRRYSTKIRINRDSRQQAFLRDKVVYRLIYSNGLRRPRIQIPY
jgi:hypothetical protein